jgi:hypothetical protein
MNKYKYGDVEHLKVKNKNKNKLKVFILFSISLIFVMSILAGCAPMEPNFLSSLKSPG